ncbi:hypothetical protein Ddye_023942 [Dipteronia dyeriana]|uniref:F-box domain-containing protein n=1 Tax=Dipteronia dyeriana TaxID=168575 RepID=A0AAD9WSJ1_9ROSI|nr:hypothetical protein Ddye_023942 [Dipteronia dyeriana]
MEELGGHFSGVSLDELKKDNGEVSLASVGLFFPCEIVFEILTWLPVKYLVRCKCVCKKWYKLIEDRSFIMKHLSRSEPIIVYYEDKVENLDVDGTIVRETFRIIHVFAGLILERGDISCAGAGAAGKRSYIACPSVVTFKRNAIGEDTSIQTKFGPVNQAR